MRRAEISLWIEIMKDIKAKLIEMQQEIIQEIELDRKNSDNSITHDVGDSIDYASEERDRELYQLLGERDRLKLQQIKEALERIEDESYGECKECGQEIGKPRLMTLPFTRLCIECKSEEERTKGNDLVVELPTPKLGVSSSMEGSDF